MRIAVLLAVALGSTLGCMSSSTGGTSDAGDASTSAAACEDAFRNVCTRAAACDTDGRARVSYGGGSAIDYESASFCRTAIVESKCGPSAPQPPVDLIRCLAGIPPATCEVLGSNRKGLVLPDSCR